MAVSPGTYNITLQRRADYQIVLQFKDSTDTAINLTGWTVASQIWNQDRTTKVADFTVSYTNRITGTVTLSLTDEQTALLSTVNNPVYYYDVLLTNGDGLKEYYLQGTVKPNEGYTA